MATPVTMPQMGESVVEGTILTWLKSEGDTVEADEPIVEVSTDKVDTEIPSPVSGVLVKILVAEGETVEVGTAICEVDESGSGASAAPATKDEPETKAAAAGSEQQPEEPAETEAAAEEPAAEQTEEDAPAQPTAKPAAKAQPASAPAAKRAAPATATEERPPAEDNGDGLVLSPIVRRLARENDVDLTRVTGSGRGGRITKQDVLDHIAAAGAAPAAQTTAAPAAHAGTAPAAKVAPPPVREAAAGRDEVRPLDRIRKRIAEHMVASLQQSARAWNAIEVDMETIARLRAQVNPAFKAREGFSLTYLPFIARACVDALSEVPVVNATMSEDGSEATFHHYVNLGIAVAADYGLIVPVVKGAESMNVVGLARAIRDLADRARGKKLSPDDVAGSTFTITNPGPFGSFVSVPIINQPNAAILSTEGIEKRVAVVDDMIAIRHRTYMCLSWDHRLLDGADAMRFLQRLKQNLETWDFSTEVSNL